MLFVGYLAYCLIDTALSHFQTTDQKRVLEREKILADRLAEDHKLLKDEPSWFKKDKGQIRVPIATAMAMTVADLEKVKPHATDVPVTAQAPNAAPTSPDKGVASPTGSQVNPPAIAAALPWAVRRVRARPRCSPASGSRRSRGSRQRRTRPAPGGSRIPRRPRGAAAPAPPAPRHPAPPAVPAAPAPLRRLYRATQAAVAPPLARRRASRPPEPPRTRTATPAWPRPRPPVAAALRADTSRRDPERPSPAASALTASAITSPAHTLNHESCSPELPLPRPSAVPTSTRRAGQPDESDELQYRCSSRCSPPSEVDATTRVPVLLFFGSSILWLLLASLLSAVGSFKLVLPEILTNVAYLTTGRVMPGGGKRFHLRLGGIGGASARVCGFSPAFAGRRCATAACLARRGRSGTWASRSGVLGILRGDGTGFRLLDFPYYASPVHVLGLRLHRHLGGADVPVPPARRRCTSRIGSSWRHFCGSPGRTPRPTCSCFSCRCRRRCRR